MKSERSVCAHCRRFKKIEHSTHTCKFDKNLGAWIEECDICGMVDYHDTELNKRGFAYATPRNESKISGKHSGRQRN